MFSSGERVFLGSKMKSYCSALTLTDHFWWRYFASSYYGLHSYANHSQISFLFSCKTPAKLTSGSVSLLWCSGGDALQHCDPASRIKELAPHRSLSVEQHRKLLLNPSCRLRALLLSSLAQCCQEVAAMETTVPSHRGRRWQLHTFSFIWLFFF